MESLSGLKVTQAGSLPTASEHPHKLAVSSNTLYFSDGTNWINLSEILESALPSGINANKIADGSVSDTEFQTLNGVTSSIQTQLDGKANTSHNQDASTITSGTLDNARIPSGIDAVKVGDGIVSNTEFGFLNGVTSGIQAQLDALAGAASQLGDLSDVVLGTLAAGEYLRYNGTEWVDSTIQEADLPSGINAAKLADGSVSNSEFQTLNGVTSAIQTQLDGKSNTGHGHNFTELTGSLAFSQRPSGGTSSDYFRGDGAWDNPVSATSVGNVLWGGTTGGTAAALTASVIPAPVSLTAGLSVKVKMHVDSEGPVTFNLNGLGAQSVKFLGEDIQAGQLRQNSVVEFTWDGANWILPFNDADGPTPWERPSDWLAMPAVLDTEQKFVGLFAVYESDTNYVAFTVSGAYTVDWGDGSPPENVASGGTAQKNIAWADIDSGTLTTRGYRQCLITITPQASNNITALNLSVRPTGTGLVITSIFCQQWLDIIFSSPQCAAPVFGGAITHSAMCERVQWLSRSNTASVFANTFGDMRSLEEVTMPQNTTTVTSVASMFQNCYRLQKLPYFPTNAVISFASFASGCVNLRYSPNWTTSTSLTGMGSVFASCVNLKYAPKFSVTSAVTTWTSTFSGCYSLKWVPLYNTAAGTNLSGMFTNCNSLKSIPQFNLAAATNLGSMFQACRSLKIMPNMDFTVTTTGANSLFINCESLERFLNTTLNFGAATSLTSTFQSCFSLRELPPITGVGSVTTMANCFNGCQSLLEIPSMTLGSLTSAGLATVFSSCFSLRKIGTMSWSTVAAAPTNPFSGCRSLREVDITGMRYAINLQAACLSRAEIVNIFTNLGTAVGAQTITVSSNPGYLSLSGADLAIATGKGWSVA